MRIRCRDLEVSCHEFGRGRPLLLVHGLADDHRAWRHVLPALAQEHRVIAADLRGHGESSLGAADGSLAQLGGDLVALLDALDLERADLCGFSLGGTIVLRVAIDHPDRTGRLIPVATSSRVGRAAVPWYSERAALADAGAAALHPVLEADTREQLARAPEQMAAHWMMRQQSTADPRGFASACRAMARLQAEPLDSELGRIGAPTLVVAAAEDPLCPPRAAEAIVAAIPGARLELIAGSGHQVEVERPRKLSQAILGFLDG